MRGGELGEEEGGNERRQDKQQDESQTGKGQQSEGRQNEGGIQIRRKEDAEMKGWTGGMDVWEWHE